jgi:ABC-type Fe3+ transport system permease subunit
MLKITLGLLALSIAMVGAFFAHAFAAGILVPYPDPTPAQAAHERFHQPISMTLFLAAAASFAACLVSGLFWICVEIIRRLRRT